MVDDGRTDDGRTDDGAWYTISSPCEPDGSGELTSSSHLSIMLYRGGGFDPRFFILSTSDFET